MLFNIHNSLTSNNHFKWEGWFSFHTYDGWYISLHVMFVSSIPVSRYLSQRDTREISASTTNAAEVFRNKFWLFWIMPI